MISQKFYLSLSRQISTKIWHLNNFMISSSSSTLTTFHQKLHTKTFDKIEKSYTDSPKTLNENPIQKYKDFYYSQNDPDNFGTNSYNNYVDDEQDVGDIAEENYLKNPPKQSDKLTIRNYAHLIKDHLKNKEIKEAIDILEVRMKNDRVQPDKYIYNILISGCAQAGFSKKAFQLFNKMKQRSLKPSGGTYTSLFNACANAPWSQDGLNKAIRLRELMLEKGYIPNVMNYNAMIKAFGRCGDVQTAYLLADEMMDKNLEIDTSTFNFLLQACASDKDFGFRHALLTWHKMRIRGISPDIYTFKTMLRCVRDSSIGDLDTMKEVISEILANNSIKVDKIENNEVILLQNPVDHKNNLNDSNTNQITDLDNASNTAGCATSTGDVILNNDTTSKHFQDDTPNLISETPHLGSLISISDIQTAPDRLLLLGGFTGFLEEMRKCRITPGIEIFTTLLEVIPSTKSAEKYLISMIRKIGLKADIDFFNILIKKRSMRFDYSGAKEVLNMIKTAKLHPDIVTYGVLALSCQTQDEARELLYEMNMKGIRMNIQIVGAMLRQGCAQKNFAYVNEIMEITLDENIKPNESFLKHLDNFYKQCSKLEESRHPLSKANNFKNNFRNFKNKLKIWYEENGIAGLKVDDAIEKIRESPYQQFKDKQPDGLEENKNTMLKRKQKIRKYIKRIKMKDLKDDDETVDSSASANKIKTLTEM